MHKDDGLFIKHVGKMHMTKRPVDDLYEFSRSVKYSLWHDGAFYHSQFGG